MFQEINEKFARVFKELRGHGKVREGHVQDAMRGIRRALLEADVNYRVVKDFTARVSEKALGKKVLDSLTPDQQIVKIVHDELVQLLGGRTVPFTLSGSPASVLIVGLQGSGKTTFSAKLAKLLRKGGRKPLLVACDVYRPAAVQQLKVLGEQISVDVFSLEGENDVVEIASRAKSEALRGLYDTLIFDTAGRLHVDEDMMNELQALKSSVEPEEVLLVLDSMTGQEAVNVAGEFLERVDFSGVVLTKLDGDARGGAALSIAAVTGKPIKFASVGERLDDLEPFHPDRMAGRILGMGDVLSLIERAQEVMDEKKAREMERKLKRDSFTLEDFLEQLQSLKKMGPLDQLLGMIPGLKFKGADLSGTGERELKRVEAIINSMTLEERRNPSIIDGSRRRRIAKGSGTSVQDVNKLLGQFGQMRKMMKRFSKLSGKMPFGLPGM